MSITQRRYILASEYIIHWDKKEEPNSAVVKFFLANVGRDGLTYWIPFSFKGEYYITTFNHTYKVEIKSV